MLAFKIHSSLRTAVRETVFNPGMVRPSTLHLGFELSNETSLVCLGYIGDYASHLCGDYNKPHIRIPINQPV